MVKSVVQTKISDIARKLLFLYLAAFPFGQLARLEITIGSLKFPLLLIDIIPGIMALLFFLCKFTLPKISKRFLFFIGTALLSLIYSLTTFRGSEIVVGLLYLLRLSAYFVFFVVVFNLVKNEKDKKTIFKSLLTVSVFAGLFGWIQYFFYPDLRSFTIWGWDDHLLRLVGTFLDPGFTSIILVLGFLTSLRYINTEKKITFILPLLLFVTTLFTYSRAGYLALLVGALVMLFKKPIIIVIFILIFVISVLLLPKKEGEGVKLERSSSVLARFENYSQTFEIIKKFPVFGVGYNNLCLVRGNSDSHSCSGSDSSLLMILATTGIVGIAVFSDLINQMRLSSTNSYGKIFFASGASLMVHSIFVNSLFYPWVMGWMLIVFAISLKE